MKVDIQKQGYVAPQFVVELCEFRGSEKQAATQALSESGLAPAERDTNSLAGFGSANQVHECIRNLGSKKVLTPDDLVTLSKRVFALEEHVSEGTQTARAGMGER